MEGGFGGEGMGMGDREMGGWGMGGRGDGGILQWTVSHLSVTEIGAKQWHCAFSVP